MTVFGYAPGGLAGGPGLLLAVFAAATVVSLYLLRERRQRVYVSFSALWTEATGKRGAARLSRRLRRWQCRGWYSWRPPQGKVTCFKYAGVTVYIDRAEAWR